MSLDVYLTIGVDVGGVEPVEMGLFDGNITHNVIPMWSKAGVYKALYESDGKLAGEIAETLASGVEAMRSRPNEYKALNPENGWGDYDGALQWLGDYAEACRKYPKAVIRVSR